jgi:hypothetical protein
MKARGWCWFGALVNFNIEKIYIGLIAISVWGRAGFLGYEKKKKIWKTLF